MDAFSSLTTPIGQSRQRRTVQPMTSGNRQRRDGSSKRVQLTSGDHSGPRDKKGKRPRVAKVDRAQRKAATSRAWKELFDRLSEVKQREQARQRGNRRTR
ncbi:conserved hypothetical protein [Streptomyces clavuligerus]|nr:conserved hypothetical protein [Streptomyces clavuligerus]